MSSDDATTRYFAIGAMMNPVSMRLRGIQPVGASKPAKLQGYRIHFFGEAGMAECLPADEGSCIHGVLHTIRQHEAEKLDAIETGYDRRYVNVVDYEGKEIDAYAYCRQDKNIQRGDGHDNPPSERYIQVLADGAAHYGVDQEYVDFLKSHEVVPRTKPEDYESFKLPGVADVDECRVYTRQEIEAADGKDGRDLLVTVNGKVLKAVCDPSESIFVRRFVIHGVVHSEVVWARYLYEPMFGEPPTRIEDFTRAHCEYFEDFFFKRVKGHGKKDLKDGQKSFACVGRYEQTYKE